MTEELQNCLKQKEILLTRIYQLALNIESESLKPDGPAPTNEILQRQVLLDRLKKCSAHISQLCGQLAPESQNRIRKVLAAGLSKSECTEAEVETMAREANCRSLLKKICACDSNSKKQLKKECDRLKKQVNSSRSKGNQGSLFPDYII
ncbi:MAG: hypothetical protein LKJ17_04300 [Oscillospiraceae bacterium]|jgi:hypothetical protein|nr:hypothetical protein [Oscillospiraceae bacterium]